jgi:ribosomal protein S6--L-glutamate ligase
MRFCFIIEAQYRSDPLPAVIAHQLAEWGHEVDMLEPAQTVTLLRDLTQKRYDAYVLRTQSDGPGMSILDAVDAVGIPTINNSRSIRLVRDKAVAAAFAHAHGLPIPLTYFVAHPRLLQQIPEDDYPLVVKPSNGSTCREIYRLDHPADLAKLEITKADHSFFLAQRYVENAGFDIKLYVAGTEVYAVARKSPLHPDVDVKQRLLPLTPELRELALRTGAIFGLHIYGLDVVETSHGFVVLDINDFPSFSNVPGATTLLTNYVLHLASRPAPRPAAHPPARIRRRCKPLAAPPLHRLSPARGVKLLTRPLTSPDHLAWDARNGKSDADKSSLLDEVR